jgi:hypothetical protein
MRKRHKIEGFIIGISFLFLGFSEGASLMSKVKVEAQHCATTGM